MTKPLTPFVDELPVPRRLVATEHAGRLTVSMRSGTHRFHRDLPESTVWRYGGTVPGPTVEAECGRPVTVDWVNELEGPLPLAVTIAPSATDADGVPVQCHPGLSGGSPDDKAAALTGHAVVHLHGGLTPASYDGWAESLFSPGQTAVFHYPMAQRAGLLWYHDHVMGVTKYHVYAGLAGLWIVRDERERELGLPEGLPFEVPLLIQDRNFDLDERGQLTGRLVHKTDPEVMEAFPPFTVVNGKVWPVLDVQPATYRFRVLNGSNARTYRLVLVHDGRPELGRITQIGTDHGLLRRAVAVPADGLVCSGACATSWPPVRVSGKPKPGSGVNASMLGTTQRSDGKPQVTYNGHPLYLFQGDSSAGDTNGQAITAFGAAWYVVSPAGDAITTQSASSGGGGSGY